MLALADWVRLVLLIVLSLGATGFANWIVGLLIGSFLAVILHWLVGWSWIWNLQAGLGAVFVLPILLEIIWKNFRTSIVLTTILGIPTFFISRYYLASNVYFAIADSISISFLVPVATLRMLQRTGLLEKLKRDLDFKIISGRHPEVVEIIRSDPKLLRTVKNDPTLITNLENLPKLTGFIKQNPSLAKIITWRKELLELIEKDHKLYDLFNTTPEVIEKIGWHLELLQTIVEYPSLIEMFQKQSDLIQLFKTDNVLIYTIKKHPETIECFKTDPKLSSVLNIHLKDIKESLTKSDLNFITPSYFNKLLFNYSKKSPVENLSENLSLFLAKPDLQMQERASKLSKELFVTIKPKMNLEKFLNTYITRTIEQIAVEQIKTKSAFSSGSPERSVSSSPITYR